MENFMPFCSQAPMGYQLLDEAGCLCDVNDTWLSILGYGRKDEVLGRCFEDFLSEKSRALYRERFPLIRSTGCMRGQDYEVVRKDGTLASILIHGHMGRDVAGRLHVTHCFIQDVTEESLEEERLSESEELFRTAFEYAPIGMALLGVDGRFLQVNLALCRMMGYSMEEMLSRDFQGMTHEEDLPQSLHAVEDMLSGNMYTIQLEKRYVHKEGRDVWALVNASLVKNSDNIPLYFVTQIQDITARKQTEQELALLAATCRQTAEGLAIVNMDGIIHFVNPAFEELTGLNQEEAVGRPWSQLPFALDHAKNFHGMWEKIERGEVWTGSVAFERADGEAVAMEMTVSPIRDRKGRITHCAFIQRDVTQERKMEMHLRQAQKMEAIGTLAGGIAHDFNNILAAILGYTELAQLKAGENSPLRSNLAQICKGAERARDLVRQILTFSRQREQPLKPLQVSVVVKEVLKLLRASLPSTIEINPKIVSNSHISADPTQIHQVVMNLCTNSAHAMKGTGGVMTITLEDVTLDSHALQAYAGIKAGEHVHLSVSDTGHGMSEHVLTRAFDPFFTTKGPGEGTGMGLAVVHGIVKSHGGAIAVESELGKGTTVRVLFPRHEGEKEKEGQLPRTHFMEGGDESILVVDDEKELVETIQQMLTHLGYRVTVCSGSYEALQVFRENPLAFDLLITDQTMPAMTGLELARMVFEIREDLPVILCSGFTDAQELKENPSFGIRAFLAKPLLMADLAAAIRQVLSEGHGGVKVFRKILHPIDFKEHEE